MQELGLSLEESRARLGFLQLHNWLDSRWVLARVSCCRHRTLGLPPSQLCPCPSPPPRPLQSPPCCPCAGRLCASLAKCSGHSISQIPPLAQEPRSVRGAHALQPCRGTACCCHAAPRVPCCWPCADRLQRPAICSAAPQYWPVIASAHLGMPCPLRSRTHLRDLASPLHRTPPIPWHVPRDRPLGPAQP